MVALLRRAGDDEGAADLARFLPEPARRGPRTSSSSAPTTVRGCVEAAPVTGTSPDRAGPPGAAAGAGP